MDNDYGDFGMSEKKDVLQRMQFDTDYDDESLDVEVLLSKQAHMNHWMMA